MPIFVTEYGESMGPPVGFAASPLVIGGIWVGRNLGVAGGYRIRPYEIPAAVHAVGAESISARKPTDRNQSVVILRNGVTKNLM